MKSKMASSMKNDGEFVKKSKSVSSLNSRMLKKLQGPSSKNKLKPAMDDLAS